MLAERALFMGLRHRVVGLVVCHLFELHLFIFLPVVYATQEILEGEEIAISYTHMFTSPERQQILASEYKFVCTCPLCSLSGKELEESARNRDALVYHLPVIYNLQDADPVKALHGLQTMLKLATTEKLLFIRIDLWFYALKIYALWGMGEEFMHAASHLQVCLTLTQGSSGLRLVASMTKNLTLLPYWAKSGVGLLTKPRQAIAPSRTMLEIERDHEAYDMRLLVSTPHPNYSQRDARNQRIIDVWKFNDPDISEDLGKAITKALLFPSESKKKKKKKSKKKTNGAAVLDAPSSDLPNAREADDSRDHCPRTVREVSGVQSTLLVPNALTDSPENQEREQVGFSVPIV